MNKDSSYSRFQYQDDNALAPACLSAFAKKNLVLKVKYKD
ncbi:UNVERIFIED_ORG: hypothetical protein EC838_1670 [Providencia alcalifaciens]